ncbi:MAG TPA: hypothetical protein VHS35_09030, partial [Pseudonocardia sp.]|nr:hypothetical protein [Pseudonocardia sp.]
LLRATIVVVLVTAALVGCGSATPTATVPDVVGQDLDAARVLRPARLGHLRERHRDGVRPRRRRPQPLEARLASTDPDSDAK